VGGVLGSRGLVRTVGEQVVCTTDHRRVVHASQDGGSTGGQSSLLPPILRTGWPEPQRGVRVPVHTAAADVLHRRPVRDLAGHLPGNRGGGRAAGGAFAGQARKSARLSREQAVLRTPGYSGGPTLTQRDPTTATRWVIAIASHDSGVSCSGCDLRSMIMAGWLVVVS
jgi:hypothetical protein